MKKKNHLFILTILFMCISARASQENNFIHATLERLVVIIALDENSQPLRIGSGFVIGSNGEIATNYHVVEGASSAIVKFINEDTKYQAMTLVNKSAIYDLAIIKLNNIKKISALSLGDDELVAVGDKIFAIGNPEGLEGTVSEGIIGGFRKIDEELRLMQITAPISPGSSGGPIINERGQVIGIASASIIIGQNLNFAIPINCLKILYSQEPLNIPFQKGNLAIENGSLTVDKEKRINLVTAFNIRRGERYQGGSQDLSFSIRNNTRRDIKNIKVLILWNDSNTGEALHFTPILIKETIPSMQTKIIQKNYAEAVGNLPLKANYEIRIIDYEILPTSGIIEFK
jgi:hypothetical protein